MDVNMTCNNTACEPPGSPAGLAVGLTFFFLLLGMAVGLAVYTQRRKLRNMLQLRRESSQKKEDQTQTPQDSHQYTSMIRTQSTEQTPIYENLQTAGHNRTVVDMDRSPSEPEEDLYLQCDSPDDAIYSNDPACSLAILPDTQGEEEDDLYIMPDAL
ncbi:uncharacterized protein LOC144542173 [Centroberyx gerrardi]